jgi:hypothetical protein
MGRLLRCWRLRGQRSREGDAEEACSLHIEEACTLASSVLEYVLTHLPW